MAQEKDKVTIYDVAEQAGVAISTVSRVLNDSHEVSEQTRQRVLAAVEKLQFRPDRTAKALAQQQSHSLAVAVPSFTSLFYNELLKGIKDALREDDIDLLLCNLGSGTPQATLWRFLNRGAVDALMLVTLPVDDRLANELRALHAPVVLVGAEAAGFDSFHWDDESGARIAMRHLIERGHKRIGLIMAHAWSFNMEKRIQGYRKTLQEAGIPFDSSLLQTGATLKHAGFSEEAGYEAMQKLLALTPRVTAVFASSDVQAIGAMKAIREAGLSIPNDVAIVGYDNIKVSRYIDLSSVDQSLYDVGRRATQLLLGRMKTPHSTPESHLIPPRLIVRGSSHSSSEEVHKA